MTDADNQASPASWQRAMSSAAFNWAVVAAFAATRVFLLFFHFHTATDLKIYRGWLRQAAEGLVPFADFPIEYPPLAWWVMQLPGTSERLPYYFRFRLLMGVADVAAFVLLWWIVRQRRPALVGLVAATYVASTVVLEFVLYDRLDLPVLMLLLGAFAAWLHAADASRPGAWRAAAYACVGLGASYKLIPVVVLPFLVVSDMRTERTWSPMLLRLGVFLVALAFPFVAIYPSAGAAALGFLRYHSTRGVEIESTWATLMWLVSQTDDTLRVIVASGAWELAGALGSLFSRVASWASMLFLVCCGVWAIALKERFDAERAYLHVLVVLAGLLTVVNVFSIQYLVWALPLLMLAGIEVTEKRGQLLFLAASCLVIATLSTAFHPFGTRYVASMNVWIMTVLAVRNLIYVGVFLWILSLVMARDRVRGPIT